MHHYLLSNLLNGVAQFHSEDHHHIRTVMRYVTGDEVIGVFQQTAYQIRLDVTPSTITGHVIRVVNHQSSSCEIILIYGLPKADKFELVLQKATELGVTQIIPYQAQKSLVKLDSKTETLKIERWKRIVKEAVEQSERLSVPVLHPIRHQLQFSDINADLKLFAYERSTSPALLSLLQQSHKTIVMAVGPEAGWTLEEAKYFESLGYTIVSLGDTILRSETAALYMVAAAKLAGDYHD